MLLAKNLADEAAAPTRAPKVQPRPIGGNLRPASIDIGEDLTVRVHDLESGVEGFNGPWWWESSQRT